MTFKPLLQERIWGGRRLAELFDKDLPPGVSIGESWELADLPNAQSVVLNGSLKGQTLRALMQQYAPQITGQPNSEEPFPLLIKFLDAQDVLSVQVHPDEDACQRMHAGRPKTECWYIVAAQPGAVIYKGLRSGTTRRDFEEALRRGTCDEVLNRVPVEVGQCHFLPSGMCHAIGRGLVIAEIQQPSDTTYRVFDWNRTDPQTGRMRQLHIQEAMESIHFDEVPLAPPTTLGRLVDAPQFKVDKGRQTPGCETLLKKGTMRVLIFLTGRGRWLCESFEPMEFVAGQAFLVPADCQAVMQSTMETEYLTVTV